VYVEKLAGKIGVEESVNEDKGKADRGKDMRRVPGVTGAGESRLSDTF